MSEDRCTEKIPDLGRCMESWEGKSLLFRELGLFPVRLWERIRKVTKRASVFKATIASLPDRHWAAIVESRTMTRMRYLQSFA